MLLLHENKSLNKIFESKGAIIEYYLLSEYVMKFKKSTGLVQAGQFSIFN